MSATSDAGRVGVWGRSGSGKSSYVKQRLRGARRVIVFDPMAEYGAQGFKTVRTIAAVRDAMRANWTGFRIAYVPPASVEARALSALSELVLLSQSAFKGSGKGQRITLVVEEMNTAFPLSGGAEKAKAFAEICSRGRHSGIEVIGVSQRIAEVATRFRGNCTETVVFVQKGPRDTQAAALELGIKADQVAALKPLHYLKERDGIITPGVVTFGRSKKG